MCRLLLLYHPDGVDPSAHLEKFRELSRDSREYQGHGWGCAWLDDDRQWRLYHDIRPAWEDTDPVFPRTRLFVAHARSAFRDEGIAVENNMPFGDGENVFAFNGELRGVRIKEAGRIGAEKIFNYIKRFDRGDMDAAVARGVEIIQRKTRYVRAMNFFLAGRSSVYICSLFNEDPDYFQLREAEIEGARVVCSDAYPGSGYPWRKIPNRSVETLRIHFDGS
ncbi:MAG: class II glutamine amidotransferase [Gammaproteobacteria bacterium]|nr:class II glutamine amidotransferase [Gammaproteobacteria bacterium]